MIATNMGNKVYYHGTNYKGLDGIMKDKKIGHEYGDGVGVFLSDDVFTSINFGQYVLKIEGIDESQIETDDVNDGYFYRGTIDFKNVTHIHADINDARMQKDINSHYDHNSVEYQMFKLFMNNN